MSLITPDFGLIFWMTVIFAIVLFILAKWGFPIITGMVQERNDRISESIRKAREAEERLSGLAEEQKRMIEESRAEQARIMREAAQARDTMLSQAREQAQTEAAGILENARQQIAAEKESALRDIRREVATLSVSVAEKVVRQGLSTGDAQMELLEKMVDEAARLN